MAVHRYGVRLKSKKHRVLIVGRGGEADIRLNHPTVSRLHLEVVVGRGGEIHVADRASRNGTRVRSAGKWQTLTAQIVGPADRLQLGNLEITLEDLLRRAPPDRAETGRGTDGTAGERPDADTDPDLPHGEVRRHPETGKVIPA